MKMKNMDAVPGDVLRSAHRALCVIPRRNHGLGAAMSLRAGRVMGVKLGVRGATRTIGTWALSAELKLP